jgi:hypothetical protein
MIERRMVSVRRGHRDRFPIGDRVSDCYAQEGKLCFCLFEVILRLTIG